MGPLAHLSHSLTLEPWRQWNVAFQPHGGSGHLGVLLSLSFTERPRGVATRAPQHRERSTACTLLHALPSAEAGTETAQMHSAFSRCRQRRRDMRDALLRMQVQCLKLTAIWQASSALLCAPCAAEPMCECAESWWHSTLPQTLSDRMSQGHTVSLLCGQVALYLFEVKLCHLRVWVSENLAQHLLNWCVSLNAPMWTYTYNQIALDVSKVKKITQKNKEFTCNNI